MIKLHENDICIFCREDRLVLINRTDTDYLACPSCQTTYHIESTIERKHNEYVEFKNECDKAYKAVNKYERHKQCLRRVI